MTHSLFYSPEAAQVKTGEELWLDAATSNHAVRSQRLKTGDEIMVSDGAGRVATGAISDANPQATSVLVHAVTTHAAPDVQLNLVQALAKGDRDLLAVEMATEIGVDSVTPWQAYRSIVRIRPDRAAKLQAKWQTKLHAAAQQARRAYIPELHAPLAAEAIAALHAPAQGHQVVVLHEDGHENLAAVVDAMAPDVTTIHLVVGPEGGVSPAELAAVQAAGGHAVKIGANVMRTSTAGPVAVTLLNQLLGRW